MGIFSREWWDAIILVHVISVAWVVAYFAVVGIIHTFSGSN